LQERTGQTLRSKKKQLKIVSQFSSTFSPSLLPPPPVHTPFDFTFKSPSAPPPPCNTPRRSTPSVFVPVTHRWMPVSCLPSTTQQVNYAFLLTGPAYNSDFTSAATTHLVPALPSMTLSVEPVPTQSVRTGPTPSQPVPTMTEHVFTMPRPSMTDHAPTMPKPLLPMHTMNEHAPTTPRPTVPGLADHALPVSMPTMPGHIMPTMSDSTVPMHALPMHTMSQPTVPGPTLPEVKLQPDTSSIGVHPSTPPALMGTQPRWCWYNSFNSPNPIPVPLPGRATANILSLWLQ